MSKIVASFVQKAKAKSGLDFAKGWLFTLVIQDTNVIVDSNVWKLWKPDDGGKETESSLKFIRINQT